MPEVTSQKVTGEFRTNSQEIDTPWVAQSEGSPGTAERHLFGFRNKREARVIRIPLFA